MKTALQELVDWFQLDTDKWDKYTQQRVKELLEKEKEQIIDAYISGDGDMYFNHVMNPEKYYNETYKAK